MKRAHRFTRTWWARGAHPTYLPRYMKRLAALTLLASLFHAAFAGEPFDDKFRQLDELLPTPTDTRTASGAPGHAYWQQRADYRIRATLDEAQRAVSGTETVTYHNNSPDLLSYLWVQLDQNMFRADSDNRTTASYPSRDAWRSGGLNLDAARFLFESRK